MAYFAAGTERTAVMMVMVSIAVMPVSIVCPTNVSEPPTRVETPVPRTIPRVPCIRPEPIVYYRSVNIYRFDDVVRTINILVPYNLNGNIVRFIFLNIYRGYILVDILRQDCLQNDQTLVAFTGLYNPQIIYLSVPVEIEVTEHTVGIIQHCLELFQVLSLCKKLSYNLQIESFRDVRTVGGNGYRFFCP